MEANEERGTNNSRVGSYNIEVPNQHANVAAAKMNSFSIEAILAAPHPKKERRLRSSQRRTTSANNRVGVDSALSTLETFASNILNNSGDKELQSKKRTEENNDAEFVSIQAKLQTIQARLNHKKRRKARTCFTNYQIFELERRFLHQKYLSPNDRDELAQLLGLSGAQIITWFQNRRARFRRELEEMKSDIEASKVIPSDQVLHLYKKLEI